jgi:metal-responsive CopG/Arc/MetJ family transcriptional regulator
MPKSIAVKPKKRGRPPTGGRDPFVGIRLPADTILAVDQWAKDNAISRSAAIRQLLEQGLATRSQKKPAKERKAQKASELANRAADRLVDKSMPVEEQQRRKRTVIKGPKEFRDIREDLPKLKKS